MHRRPDAERLPLAQAAPASHAAAIAEFVRQIRPAEAMPQDEQDAIASQILDSLGDEETWKKRFVDKRDVVRRMAQQAIEEDEKGETLPLADLL